MQLTIDLSGTNQLEGLFIQATEELHEERKKAEIRLKRIENATERIATFPQEANNLQMSVIELLRLQLARILKLGCCEPVLVPVGK